MCSEDSAIWEVPSGLRTHEHGASEAAGGHWIFRKYVAWMGDRYYLVQSLEI